MIKSTFPSSGVQTGIVRGHGIDRYSLIPLRTNPISALLPVEQLIVSHVAVGKPGALAEMVQMVNQVGPQRPIGSTVPESHLYLFLSLWGHMLRPPLTALHAVLPLDKYDPVPKSTPGLYTPKYRQVTHTYSPAISGNFL